MATDEQEQTETERKYDVDAGFVVPDLAGSGGVDSMGPPDVQHLAATYYDTGDLRRPGPRPTPAGPPTPPAPAPALLRHRRPAAHRPPHHAAPPHRRRRRGVAHQAAGWRRHP